MEQETESPVVDDPAVAESSTMWGLLERRVALTPDSPMLLDDRDRGFSFAEVLEWSERAAAGLWARGVRDGTPFTWQLPTRAETVVLSLALSRLGAVQNPVIVLYREREVGSLLRTTGARWFAALREWNGFGYEKMALSLFEHGDEPFEILLLDDGLPEGDPGSLPPAPTDGDEVRWLYSTSGTTSEPKAVRHTDGTLIAGGIGWAEAVRPASDEIGSVPFPYAHIGGPDQLVAMLRCGFPALLMESFVPAAAAELIRRHGVTMLCGSTAHYLAMLDEQRRHPKAPVIPSVRSMSGGGAPMAAEVYWRVKRELGAEVRHGYGMTESPMITMGAADDTDEQRAETEGAPVRGCEVRIVDAERRPVEAGTEGDIEVRGPMLAKGYTDPELTRASFMADGFFRTGDRGFLRPDGHMVLTGRTKDLIIRKGENISPLEIEEVLAAHPKVGAVAVVGLADPDRGERVCAVVELVPGADELTFLEVQDGCREAGLMTQKIPERLEIIDALPRNPTMKVLKRELVVRYSSPDK